MNLLDRLDPRYRVILCDIWGCVHDGVALYPGAAERLARWKREQRTIILITNAPRTAEAVARQLDRLRLARWAYDWITTSGEAGIAALTDPPRPLGFCGTGEDRAILASRGVRFASGDAFAELACTGLDEARDEVAEYHDDLDRWAAGDVLMHCLNPDRMVIRGGNAEPCAGALADAYAERGGRVAWYGKPHGAIYAHALRLAGDPPPTAVLAIGDGIETDILGAARAGLDCIFVSGGIHAGKPFPENFAATHGLGDWSPVAVVPSLG